MLIDRAIADLQKLPPTERIELTLKHLQTCSMLMAELCNPSKSVCGDTMEFDVPPAALTTIRG